MCTRLHTPACAAVQQSTLTLYADIHTIKAPKSYFHATHIAAASGEKNGIRVVLDGGNATRGRVEVSYKIPGLEVRWLPVRHTGTQLLE